MKKLVTIAGTEETIIKPIVNTISKDILDLLKLNNIEDFSIMYDGVPILKEYYSGSSTLDKSLKSNILEVTVKEEPIQDLELTRVPIHPDSEPLYFDKEINTKCVTAYRGMKLNFSFVLKSKNKSFITKVIDLLHLAKIDGEISTYHNIQISFQLPNIIKAFISEILKIKNSYSPVSMENYVKETFNQKYLDAYLSLDGDKNKSTISIKEYQSNVLGYFIGEFFEQDKDKDGIYYTLPLTYHLQFQKPISVHMEFPYLIYNKKLPEPFMTKVVNYVEKNFRGHEEGLITLLNNNPSYGINKKGYYLTYPKDDDFDIQDSLFAYYPIISLLCVVDPNDPTNLFNIKKMGSIKFLDIIEEFIILQRDYVTKYQQSLFYFSIYENDCLKSHMLTLNELGDLKTNINMDIRNTYRVMIYICNDISVIPFPNKRTILDFLNENFKNGGDKLFLDSYLGFFNLDKSTVFKIWESLTSKSASNLLLQLDIPNYSWMKMSAWHHTEVYRLLKEK